MELLVRVVFFLGEKLGGGGRFKLRGEKRRSVLG